MTSLTELLSQRAALDAAIAEVQRKERTEALTKIRQLAADFGLTGQELARLAPGGSAYFGGKASGAKSVGASVSAKYRDPETGSTWAGRGKRPAWLTEKLNSGQNLVDFLIDKQEHAEPPPEFTREPVEAAEEAAVESTDQELDSAVRELLSEDVIQEGATESQDGVQEESQERLNRKQRRGR